MKTKLALLTLVVFIVSCSNIKKDEPNVNERPVSEHALTMATLYNYYADEYRALAYQAFNIARERVDEIRNDQPDNDKLAIVVDIDETLLAKANIKLTWMDYSGYPQYNQLFPPFEHWVSIIDLIFNEGPEAKNFLKSNRNG